MIFLTLSTYRQVLIIIFIIDLGLLTFKHVQAFLLCLATVRDMNDLNPFIKDRATLALRLAAEKLSAMKKKTTAAVVFF